MKKRSRLPILAGPFEFLKMFHRINTSYDVTCRVASAIPPGRNLVRRVANEYSLNLVVAPPHYGKFLRLYGRKS